MLRQLVATADEIAADALNPLGRDAETLLDEAESKIFKIAEAGAGHNEGFVHINPLLTQVVERDTFTVGPGSRTRPARCR